MKENDPLGILSKPVKSEASNTIEPDAGDPLGILKKKGVSGSSSLGQTDFIAQQRQQFDQPAPPSVKSTPKSTPPAKKETGFIAALKDMASGYDKPADPKDIAPQPFVNAINRGLNLAEQSNLIGPFADKPGKVAIAKVSELQRETQALPSSPVYKQFSEAKTFGTALKTFVSDPVQILAELTGESMAAMAKYGAPRIGAGAAIGAGAGALGLGGGAIPGAAGGAIVGMADTSYGLEFTGKFLESLQEAGVDTKNPEALAKAFTDEAILDKARSAANRKAIPIALFDLISGGIAGKIVAKPAKSIAGKVGAGAIELTAQSLMGAGGEVAGELASGEKLQPGAILGEALGELGTSPVEVSLGAVVEANKQGMNKTDPASVEVASAAIENATETPAPLAKQQEETPQTGKVQDVIDQQDADKNVQQSDNTSAIQADDEGVGQPGTAQAGPGEGGPVLQGTGEQADNTGIPEGNVEQPATESTQIDEAQESEIQPSAEVELQGIDTGDGRNGTYATGQPEPRTSDVPSESDTEGLQEGSQESEVDDGVQTGSAVLDQQEEQKVSGIKKALVSQEKIDATPIERRSAEQMLQRAKEQVDSGEVNPKAIVDEISQGNARALQPDEVSSLVYYKTQLDNRSDQLNTDLVAAIESQDTDAQAALRTQLDAVNKEIDNYQTMALKTAYEQSLAFRLRQMLLDNEYNLQSQVNKYKAANNGEISPETEQKFKDLDKQLKEANAKLRKMEEEQSVASSAEAMQNIRQNLQKQKEARAKAAQARKEKINDFFNNLKIKSDPNRLHSITQVVGEAVWNGSLEAVKTAVLAGSDAAAALKAGIDYVKEHYRGTDFNEEEYASMVQPGLESLVPSEPSVGKPSVKDGKLNLPASFIRSFVEGGAKDINELVDQIKEAIKDVAPDASKREIRDAITRYGETRQLSKDEIDTKLRGMRRMGRLISSLEDVMNKKRPMRSGLQRDKPSDEERKLQREIKEGMKDLPVDQSEIDKAWKNALDAVKMRLKNQIADLNKQIETGEKTPKKKGIAYDDEANSLKAERDRLKKVIEDIEGRPKMSDEQKVRMATAAVEKQIAEYERRISQKDTSKKDKSPAPVTPELAALRQRRDDLKKSYQQMEADLGVAETRRLDAYKKAIKKSTAWYEQRIKDQDFVRQKKKPLALDEEATKLKLERDKIKQQFDLEQEKARLKNRKWNEVLGDTVVDLWNVPKSLKSTLDMSAPFRQGAVLSAANPMAAGRAFREMFRQAFSQKKADEWLLLLRESPLYALIKQSKLYVAEPTTKLTAKEESFLSNIADRIPIIGNTLDIKTRIGNIKIPGLGLVGGSNRAYVAYLNKLRVDVFAYGATMLQDQGITPENNPEAYKQWASFINNASGRGNLGGAEMAAPLLNGAFFAPRYVASRFNILNPWTYIKMPAPVAKMALRNTLTYIGFTALFASVLGAGFDDLDVEWDPRSSDFGKIRFGDTRFDLWAGFQQLVRTIAQFSTGERKSSKNGDIIKLSKDIYPYETRADIVINFLRSKAAPLPGSIWNLSEGENIVGEETNLKTEVISNIMPLYLHDMAEIYEEDGPTGVLTSAVPAFFGIGVQSYGEKSGLANKEIDEGGEIQKLNKSRKYSISQPSKGDLTESLDHDVDDVLFDDYVKRRDQEIKRQFDRYKGRLEAETDIQIYDKLMDQIVKEAGRDAKYKIAREKGWRETADSFKPGNPFRLRNYKKNEEGKVVPR